MYYYSMSVCIGLYCIIINVVMIGGPRSFIVNNKDLYVDHQNMLFNQGVTLSWKPVNGCNDYKIISRTRCGRKNLIHIEREWNNITQLSRYISSDCLSIGEDNKRADFRIEAITDDGIVCNKTEATLQVKDSGN